MIILKVSGYGNSGREVLGGYILKADDLETKVDNPLDIFIDEIRTLIEEGSLGVSLNIELGQMTEEEYSNLGDFEGW